MIWYEEEVERLEKEKLVFAGKAKMIFYGSSSIRLWQGLENEFKEFDTVNLGFGGSTLAACVWFFKRILSSFSPSHLVLYAGDNDLGDKRNPEEVFIFLQQFLAYFKDSFPGISFSFISIKPSITRWDLIENIRYANTLIKQEVEKSAPNFYYVNVYDRMLNAEGKPNPELFENDGLHLSLKGYAVWKEILNTHFQQIIKIT